MTLGKYERVEILIDPETREYKVNINNVNLERLQAVFMDMLMRINDGSLIVEPEIEVINENK